jgi:hypothetical protein
MPYSNAELRWLECILIERFGGDWQIESTGTHSVLRLVGSVGKVVLESQRNEFIKPGSYKPVYTWNARAEGWATALDEKIPAPGINHVQDRLIDIYGTIAYIKYDILGLIFWMLCRVEEIGSTSNDSHDRFPATASHAYINGYLDRPIVDEWLFILAQVVKMIWPDFSLKKHYFKIRVSHDVDSPSQYCFSPTMRFIYTIASDIKRGKNFLGIALAPWIRLRTSSKLHRMDPANTFQWIMDKSENIGVKSAFYFVCGRTNIRHDPFYQIDHPAIRNLMRQINLRGHEIGLHPSYSTYLEPGLLKSEADRLRQVADEEAIHQEQWGGRMHYLRWKHPKTLRSWVDAGMDYDSSLGYADIPGFRCGTCFEYPAFDPELGMAYKFRIRPLIAMECSVILEQYLGLGLGDQAFTLLESLKSRCKAVNGCFTLLWHNSELSTIREKELYSRILTA